MRFPLSSVEFEQALNILGDAEQRASFEISTDSSEQYWTALKSIAHILSPELIKAAQSEMVKLAALASGEKGKNADIADEVRLRQDALVRSLYSGKLKELFHQSLEQGNVADPNFSDGAFARLTGYAVCCAVGYYDWAHDFDESPVY